MPSPHEASSSPPLTGPGASNAFTRRRFLIGLGALAVTSLATPLLRRFGGRWRSEAMTRVERERPMLGTWVRVTARHADERLAERAIDGAFRAIAQVDAQMSIHRADSELARVNAAAGRHAVAVSTALLGIVERARLGAEQTRQVYDPTVLPLMRLYGFYHSGRQHLPSDREIAAVLAAMGPEVIAIDRTAGTLGLTRAGAALDLGSIGKGFALDRAVEALRAEGVTSGLVDVGRNLYALGTPSEREAGWRVGVIDPLTNEVARVFTLRDRAVGTSGNAEQWTTLDGRRVGHLLDARLGRPAAMHRSATVVARTGTTSDEGSTRAFLLGRAGLTGLPDVLDTHLIG